MSDSVQPQRRQPTRLPHPWDSPGKNTGVGCHFLLQCMKVESEREVAQSCPTPSDLMDCSPPGSSVPGILQARALEWGAIAFSGRSLVGCSPWGCSESDMTERLHFQFSLPCIGEGNGNPLQCPCLENPRDRGAWWAAVCGVAQNWTRLKRLSSSSSRLVITFLPRSKCLLISWLQSPSAVILEPKK